MSLAELVNGKPKTKQVTLTREPPREAVTVSHGRVRRMEAETIDPVAAENALKNAQASAMARATMAEVQRETSPRTEQYRDAQKPAEAQDSTNAEPADNENVVWGVGIAFELDPYGNVKVSSVSPSCHAGRGGIVSKGDSLKAVGGVSVKGMTIEEVRKYYLFLSLIMRIAHDFFISSKMWC